MLLINLRRNGFASRRICGEMGLYRKGRGDKVCVKT